MILAEPLQVTLELRGQGRPGFDALTGEGVLEGELGGMEELPAERRLGDAVHGVAHDRQLDGGEVNSDLMGPPRLQPNTEEGVAADQLLDLEMGDGVPRRVRVERSTGRIRAVTTDRGFDSAPPRAWTAAHERGVRPLEGPLPHQFLQPFVCFLRAGHDEQP
jgi:hypothetical protein